jgi:diguanylate cyclase (GGDEF)-like protein
MGCCYAPGALVDSQQLQLPESILVIEDDPTIRAILAKTFEKTSRVLEAKTGTEGLQRLLEDRPEFVITDVMLPGLTGVELITQARRTYFGACVPILVLTASPEKETLLQAFREGADDFMSKPFSVKELQIRVASVHLRQRLIRDMNPLTRLPGNLAIKRQIGQRLESGEVWAIANLDLDHFKGFNDARGFDLGDEVIKLVAELLIAYTVEHPGKEIFLGHIGGDDFMVVLPFDEVDEFSSVILGRFESAVARHYSPEERLSGYTQVINRKGEPERVPLLSLSIGVTHTGRTGVQDLRKVAEVSAEVKKQAKAIAGNSVFVDRRKG